MPRVERAGAGAVEQLRQRVADEAPLLEVHVPPVGGLLGDAERFGGEPRYADQQEDAEDQRVLGLRLDADAVGPLHVPTHDRPHDAGEEHDAGGIADERVRLVGAPHEDLHALGQLMVDLEHRGHGQEHEEPEVDHRVHQPGGRVAQQRAHVGAGAEVGEAPLRVLGRGAAAIGAAALPVPHPLRERPGTPDDHHRDHRVEGDLEWPRDAREDLAGHLGVAVPLGDQRHDAGQHGERGDGDADAQDELMGFDALLARRGRRRRGCVRAHGKREPTARQARRPKALGRFRSAEDFDQP